MEASAVLDLLILAGAALLSVRLLLSGLNRRYQAFFYYLVFYTLQTGLMMRLNIRSNSYFYTYILTEPISWIFYALVVLELYSLVLEDYRGLYTASRWALVLAVTLAVAGSAISLLAPIVQWQGGRVMAYYHVAERAVYLSLVIFLLTILVFLLQYPITLRRNVIVHSLVYSFYFLASTVSFLLLTTRGSRATAIVKYTILAATLGSLASWLILLSPAGEERKVSLRPNWMPGQEEALVSQLNSLNAALLRAGRK